MNEQIELMARGLAHSAGVDWDSMGIVSKIRTMNAVSSLIFDLRSVPEFEEKWTG